MFARSCGLQIDVAEVDVLRVLQAVNMGSILAEEGVLIDDILELLSGDNKWNCVFVPREGNFVAHFQALLFSTRN